MVRRGLRELVGLYWESGVSADIPALAWYLLSSLVPLALGLTTLAAIALGDYAQAQALAARVSRVLPEDVLRSGSRRREETAQQRFRHPFVVGKERADLGADSTRPHHPVAQLAALSQ